MMMIISMMISMMVVNSDQISLQTVVLEERGFV